MPRLIAIALPTGPRFLHELDLAWQDGDCVFPVDVRLPDQAQNALMAQMRPSIVVHQDGRKNRPDGKAVADGDALVVATSGTTGTPKGVVLTFDAVQASADATSNALGVTASDKWLACLPAAHVGGLSVMTRALLTGTPVEPIGSPEPESIAQAAADGATLVSLVPAVLDRIDPASFRKILLGGSAIPADRPSNSMATYGLTETGSGVVYDGRPLDGVEIKIVDDEIHVRGPMLLRGYRDGSTPLTDDGWLATGDHGSFDDGVLQVFGRSDDTIITGGEKVYPIAVERILTDHEAVAEVAVVGRAHPKWGQAVTAIIQPADGMVPDLDELRDLVKAQLAAYAAPHAIEVVDGFERTALGKIRRASL